MDKKIINQLIERSLANNELNRDKILSIAAQLNRTQLKIYIDGLKKWVREHTVIIETAKDVSKDTKDEFKRQFSGKRVVFRSNPDLLLGVKVTDNDTVYEMDLKDSLEHVRNYLLS